MYKKKKYQAKAGRALTRSLRCYRGDLRGRSLSGPRIKNRKKRL